MILAPATSPTTTSMEADEASCPVVLRRSARERIPNVNGREAHTLSEAAAARQVEIEQRQLARQQVIQEQGLERERGPGQRQGQEQEWLIQEQEHSTDGVQKFTIVVNIVRLTYFSKPPYRSKRKLPGNSGHGYSMHCIGIRHTRR